MFALISRNYGEVQTPGVLVIFDQEDVVFQCKSLELPYLENHKNISCIPPGEYDCDRIHHRSFGICYLINNVPERSGILIHIGNYAAMRIIFERAIERGVRAVDTLGCILVGLKFVDINRDGFLDVSDSTRAMNALRAILPSKFKLIIR